MLPTQSAADSECGRLGVLPIRRSANSKPRGPVSDDGRRQAQTDRGAQTYTVATTDTEGGPAPPATVRQATEEEAGRHSGLKRH